MRSVAVFVALLGVVALAAAQCADQGVIPLTMFRDRLPNHNIINIPEDRHVTIELKAFRHRLHKDLPQTTMMYGYAVAGQKPSYPGPAFNVWKNQPLWVTFVNKLPSTHLLNPSVVPKVSTHLHGGRIAPEDDGFPVDAYGPGENKTHYYPNTQKAAFLWYHDHAILITKINVYAGLAGGYLLRDSDEAKLNLPSGPYEMILVFQEKILDANAQLSYQPWNSAIQNYMVVNGKIWPFADVEPRKYRIRLLNGNDVRFLLLSLSEINYFDVIATEQGFLASPVRVLDLEIAPGERYDIIVDFSNFAGKNITLRNSGPDHKSYGPTPRRPSYCADSILMQFRVKNMAPVNVEIPTVLSDYVPNISPSTSVMNRTITLDTIYNPPGVVPPEYFVIQKKAFDEPVEEFVTAGTTEIWEVINLTNEDHPFHIHLVHFQVLSRTRTILDTDGTVYEHTLTPYPEEFGGWKDTAITPAATTTKLLVVFPPGFHGTYVYHCHMLLHEDHDMMRPFTVVLP
jgi:spore coat protein A